MWAKNRNFPFVFGFVTCGRLLIEVKIEDFLISQSHHFDRYTHYQANFYPYNVHGLNRETFILE